MELLERIKEDLKSQLSEKRYIHSVGVMNKAKELAKRYGESEEKAELAGLLHDNAKEMPMDKALTFAKENNIELDEIEKENLVLIHGKIGAEIARQKYGIDDDVYNAIKYHTTTDKRMNNLAKIVYISDKIEDNRKSDLYDIEYERTLASKDIDNTLIYLIGQNIKSLIDRQILIHPKALETRNYILMKKENKEE